MGKAVVPLKKNSNPFVKDSNTERIVSKRPFIYTDGHYLDSTSYFCYEIVSETVSSSPVSRITDSWFRKNKVDKKHSNFFNKREAIIDGLENYWPFVLYLSFSGTFLASIIIPPTIYFVMAIAIILFAIGVPTAIILNMARKPIQSFNFKPRNKLSEMFRNDVHQETKTTEIFSIPCKIEDYTECNHEMTNFMCDHNLQKDGEDIVTLRTMNSILKNLTKMQQNSFVQRIQDAEEYYNNDRPSIRQWVNRTIRILEMDDMFEIMDIPMNFELQKQLHEYVTIEHEKKIFEENKTKEIEEANIEKQKAFQKEMKQQRQIEYRALTDQYEKTVVEQYLNEVMTHERNN